MAEERVYDAVYHKLWKASLTRICRHPAVCRVFGHGEPCAVCVYTCRKCSCAVTYKNHGGVSCGYEEESNEK